MGTDSIFFFASHMNGHDLLQIIYKARRLHFVEESHFKVVLQHLEGISQVGTYKFVLLIIVDFQLAQMQEKVTHILLLAL